MRKISILHGLLAAVFLTACSQDAIIDEYIADVSASDTNHLLSRQEAIEVAVKAMEAFRPSADTRSSMWSVADVGMYETPVTAGKRQRLFRFFLYHQL